MRLQLPVSERRTCAVVGQPRATQRRKLKVREDEAALAEARQNDGDNSVREAADRALQQIAAAR